ncbi:MAG TPA: 4'-phosphopantetheinyl transferase superfamily protein [Gillisia sp.]|nr:4'-phosphopantetheinyl transferase superfamily protein [Gillisia sp.]
MNGNDIVDLKIAKIPLGIKGTRFLDKIFSSPEQEIIKNGRVGVWAIWAMKEAVYKAHHRRYNLPRSFDPKKIHVCIGDVTQNIVFANGEYLGYDYLGRGVITSEYVHFTATCFPQTQMFSEIFNSSSINIKTQLKLAISNKLNLETEEMEIVKNNNFIPQIRFGKYELNLPFSISHHGKFSAFSFQLINY